MSITTLSRKKLIKLVLSVDFQWSLISVDTKVVLMTYVNADIHTITRIHIVADMLIADLEYILTRLMALGITCGHITIPNRFVIESKPLKNCIIKMNSFYSIRRLLKRLQILPQ